MKSKQRYAIQLDPCTGWELEYRDTGLRHESRIACGTTTKDFLCRKNEKNSMVGTSILNSYPQLGLTSDSPMQAIDKLEDLLNGGMNSGQSSMFGPREYVAIYT